MDDTPAILVISALPYANGPIHLGHLVEYIQTDICVRFQRLSGHTCYYVCADDTHGTPIILKAEAERVSPECLIERMHADHLRDFTGFHIAFDNYYSTNSPETRSLAEAMFHRLREQGLIDVRSIEQLYDPVKAMFLPDRLTAYVRSDFNLSVYSLPASHGGECSRLRPLRGGSARRDRR